MPNYTNRTAEGYTYLVNSIKRSTEIKSNYDTETVDAAKVLASYPYAKLNSQMTSGKFTGKVTIKNLITAMMEYYTMTKENNIDFGKDSDKVLLQNVFAKLNEKLNGFDRTPESMTTVGFYRLFRHTYIEAQDQKAYDDASKSAKDEITSYVNGNGYLNSALSPAGDSLSQCMDALKDCNRTFRGSSDAFKEMERELKNLHDFILENGSLGKDGARGKYVSIMLRALAEKADQYVEDRKFTELEHSANGYKGKRIAAMRKVSSMLKANADALDASFDKVLDVEAKKDMVMPDFNLEKALKDKLGKMTFSRTLYANIRHMTKYDGLSSIDSYMDNYDVGMVSMNNGLRKRVVPFEKCDKIYDMCYDETNRYNEIMINKNNDITDEEFARLIKNQERKLDDRLASMTGDGLALLDDMVFEPSYFTGDTDVDVCMVAARRRELEDIMSENNIEPKKTDIYQLNKKNDGDVVKQNEKKSVEALKQDDKNMDMGPLF